MSKIIQKLSPLIIALFLTILLPFGTVHAEGIKDKNTNMALSSTNVSPATSNLTQAEGNAGITPFVMDPGQGGGTGTVDIIGGPGGSFDINV